MVEDYDKLITTEEVAQRVGFNVQWVRQQVRAGVLRPIAFNSRTWRWHWPSVLEDLKKLQN